MFKVQKQIKILMLLLAVQREISWTEQYTN